MKKFRKKNKARFIDNKLKTILIVTSLLGLFLFGGAVVVNVFFDLPEPWDKVAVLITSIVDALSVFLVPLLSILATYLVLRSKRKMEEALKIEPDHHKIICQYKKHSREYIDFNNLDENKVDGNGIVISISNVADGATYNPEQDVNSDAYFERQREANLYKSGRLLLPSVNVFTNNLHNISVSFDDSAEFYKLPDLLKGNETKLISAHSASNVSNNVTIRLKDFTYDPKKAKLTLKTERSNYIDMLMTNRCMDFDLDGVSVRSVYESGETVSPLNKSLLCNQIGINGLVYTSDNYLLIEKRGRKKAVWKNKFAQPISLALKLNDIEVDENGKIGSSEEAADECFKKVISKTLRGNFGLKVKDANGKGDYDFKLSNNFMGIARDLVEGGKPNLYFYVRVDMSAEQLKTYLETNYLLTARINKARSDIAQGVKWTKNTVAETPLSAVNEKYKKELIALLDEGYIVITQEDGKDVLAFVSASEVKAPENKSELRAKLDNMTQRAVDEQLSSIRSKNLPKINKDKLDSRFYLIKRKDIVLDYNYSTKIPANRMLGVQRKFAPCVKKPTEFFEKLRNKKYAISDKKSHYRPMRKGCGEALLSSLYYAAVLNIDKSDNEKENTK